MDEVIYRQIWLLSRHIVAPIEIVSGSEIPIRLELMDYTIPTAAIAKIYVTSRPNGLVYVASGSVTGNAVTFVPADGFFAPGQNRMQLELNGKLIPLSLEVICHPRISLTGDPATPEAVKPLTLRAESAASSAESSATTAVGAATSAAESATTATIKATAAASSATTAASSATAAASSATAAASSATAAQESAELVTALLYNNAGAHNSIYRGKFLGNSVTAAQYAAIASGTFDDLYIGDYWEINSVTYRIAAFDYYLRAGDTDMTTHHVTIVPDYSMYTHRMNATNITTGGYVGSDMRTDGLEQAKAIINTAFGPARVLTHRQYLCNAVTNGKPSGGSWYDSTVELMTEQNCYGGKVFGAVNDGSTVPDLYTVDKSQFPLFAFRPDMIANRNWFWLRDVVSANDFARINGSGVAVYGSASGAYGVRPAFSIIG